MVDLARFKAVIFDFDGVLVDSETLQANAWQRLADELGMPDLKIDVAQTAGRMDRNIAPELFYPPHDPAQCVARKWVIQDEMESAGRMRPIAGAIELVQRLSPSHKLAIASSTWPHKIDRWLKRERQLASHFSAVVACGDSIPCKPAPDCYLQALSALQVKANRTCAVEDSPTGIAAARAAGIFTIQLLHPYMQRDESADAHIGSLNELH